MFKLPQSDVIFGALLGAFLIYITLRGQLPAYARLFVHNGASAAGSSPGVPGSSSSGGGLDIGQAAANVGESVALQAAGKAALAFIGI